MGCTWSKGRLHLPLDGEVKTEFLQQQPQVHWDFLKRWQGSYSITKKFSGFRLLRHGRSKTSFVKHLLKHILHKPAWFRCFLHHRKDKSLKSGNIQAVAPFSQQISAGHCQLTLHFSFWGGRLRPSTTCMKLWFCQSLEAGKVWDSSYQGLVNPTLVTTSGTSFINIFRGRGKTLFSALEEILLQCLG